MNEDMKNLSCEPSIFLAVIEEKITHIEHARTPPERATHRKELRIHLKHNHFESLSTRYVINICRKHHIDIIPFLNRLKNSFREKLVSGIDALYLPFINKLEEIIDSYEFTDNESLQFQSIMDSIPSAETIDKLIRKVMEYEQLSENEGTYLRQELLEFIKTLSGSMGQNKNQWKLILNRLRDIALNMNITLKVIDNLIRYYLHINNTGMINALFVLKRSDTEKTTGQVNPLSIRILHSRYRITMDDKSVLLNGIKELVSFLAKKGYIIDYKKFLYEDCFKEYSKINISGESHLLAKILSIASFFLDLPAMDNKAVTGEFRHHQVTEVNPDTLIQKLEAAADFGIEEVLVPEKNFEALKNEGCITMKEAGCYYYKQARIIPLKGSIQDALYCYFGKSIVENGIKRQIEKQKKNGKSVKSRDKKPEGRYVYQLYRFLKNNLVILILLLIVGAGAWISYDVFIIKEYTIFVFPPKDVKVYVNNSLKGIILDKTGLAISINTFAVKEFSLKLLHPLHGSYETIIQLSDIKEGKIHYIFPVQ